MVDSTKTAGIVTAVFSLFQHFHAGSINHMKLPRKFFPDFLAQAATTFVIAVKKPVFCDLHFISTVAAAMPEY